MSRPPGGTLAAAKPVAIAPLFALLCALSTTSYLAAAPPPAEADPPERLLLLAPGQPLRIDLALSIDGRPLRAFWRSRLEELAADADRDHRGRLTVEQAVRLCEAAAGEFGAQPPRAELREALMALAKADTGQGSPVGDAPSGPATTVRDDRIDREAIFQYLATTAAPFVVAANMTPGSAAAPALFGLIDVNHDGQLSRAELAGAAAGLVVRDFDDDGLISERELIVDPSQHAERTSEEETVSQTAPKAATLLWLGAETTTTSAAAAIVRRYDRDGDGKLLVRGAGESVEMNLSAAAIRRLDTSGDGLLDAAEVEAIVTEPTEILLPLAFGTASSAGQAFAVLPGKSSELRIRKKIDGGFKIYVDDAQIDINRNNRNPQQNGGLELRFARFDVDKSGYMDVKESQADPLVATAFAGMDSDGDGQVVASEFQAYVETQNASAAARLRLEVIDRGQDLFSAVDSNGDGLLTPRELAEAVALIDNEDRNGDGLLSGLEIPARWSLNVARGSSRQLDARPVRLRVREKQLAAGEAGPVWFRKMDRNHDGDVSRREYLGTAADFSAADTSGDGLIDAAEATAVGGGK